jgi:hypothetical protein
MSVPGKMNGVLAAAAVGAALVFSYFGFFFFRDNFTTHYPFKVISAAAFRSGEIPWWNFHDMGGQPLAGNPNALTFYPDNVFYLFLPGHVAFNLHFLIHLFFGFAAMRALCRARGLADGDAAVGGFLWLISGVVISATAFYNLVTGVALIPLALLGVEKRSARILGCAFGLMLLGSEPMMMLGTALAVAIAGAGRTPWKVIALAIGLALAIGAPQLVAYSEIAGEVERSVPFSPTAVLATSLTWTRVAEIFLWPVSGFLNDAGGMRGRLFSTIFIGIIAMPALFTRSRYAVIAIVCLFLALGSNNPFVDILVRAVPPSIRIARFPEKLVMPMTAALVVLIAGYLTRTRFRRAWLLITCLPLLWAAVRALPVDWFAPYRVEPRAPVRVHWTPTVVAGRTDARTEYHRRAAALDWMFGATANLRYGVGPSPDNMHALLSRAVSERFTAVTPEVKARYLRINGCNLEGALPMAMIVPATAPARNLIEAVRTMESPRFDERIFAVAPMSIAGFRSSAGRVESYVEDGQTIRIDVNAAGPVLIMVNQSFFENWVARSGDIELETVPLNVDRLGVIVAGGRHEVSIAFGRRRIAVIAGWIVSAVLLLGSAFPSFVEKLDRRSSEIKRTADEDGAHV